MRESDNRLVIFVGLIASILSIFVFATGIENLQDLLARLSWLGAQQDKTPPSAAREPQKASKASEPRAAKKPVGDQSLTSKHATRTDGRKPNNSRRQEPANPDKILVDESTELLWTVQALGSQLYLHEAEKACRDLSITSLSDWRLPAIDELEGIYDPGAEASPRILGGIQIGGLDAVWSSSKFDSNNQWTFDYGNGRRTAHSVNYNVYDIRALCVHSVARATDTPRKISSRKARAEYLTANPPRFVDPDRPDRAGLYTQDPGPVVLDRKTGLYWMRRDNGYPLRWEEAIEYCQNISFGGYSDWRLAAVADLRSLYNSNDKGLSVESGIEVYGSRPWSSDRSRECPRMGDFPCVYRFFFTEGSVFSSSSWLYRDQFDRALCVRGPDLLNKLVTAEEIRKDP